MNLIEKLRGNIVVSCQALEGEPLNIPGYMTKMALAASMGGAVAVRANGPGDIASIKNELGIPVIGIWKVTSPNSNVFITPTIEAAREVYKAGADIIGVDATFRKNCEGKWAWEIIRQIKEEMDVLVMADISTLEEGIKAAEEGADIIGTTLSGYTEHTRKTDGPDFNLIKELSSKIDVPIMAEGRISTVDRAKRAFDLGAHSITIGSSITRPMDITKSYVEGIEEYHKTRENKELAYIEEYYRNIISIIDDTLLVQKYKIISIAKEIAERVQYGGIIHVFGTGHSHMIAEDAFYRAGGLACVNAILEPNLMLHNGADLSSWMERVEGLSEQILKKHNVNEKDTMIIVSNSGINPVPVEMAMEAKKRGLYTVAITSENYSNVDSRHSSGKKLYELTDEVLNNNSVVGDAVVEIKDDTFMGATSTISGSILIQMLMIEVAHYLDKNGIEPPIIKSVNTDNAVKPINKNVIDQYSNRIRF